MRTMIPVMSLALLAACNSSKPPVDEPVNGQSGEIDEHGVPAGADAVIAPDPEKDEAQAAQAATDAAMAQPMGKAFPKSFQGRWGLVAADCTSTRGDAKGLMTVSGDQLRFYESVGTVKVLTIKSPDSVTADLAFEGEGQTWKRTIDFALGDGGRTMVRTDRDPSYRERYTRCG